MNSSFEKLYELLSLFEKCSCFYIKMVYEVWEKYSRHKEDLWESLFIFLEYYAFERQGRKPDYFHAAVDALSKLKREKASLDKTSAKRLWNIFKSILNDKSLNRIVNPLCPSDEFLEKNNQDEKLSLLEVVVKEKLSERKLTFTTYPLELIRIHNDVKPAFDFLKKIRGIGDKIAAFYLRDLVVLTRFRIKDNINNRYLLQPVDIWVKRVVEKIIAPSENNWKEIAKRLTYESLRRNLMPEKVNMGIWFACSQIIRSGYRLQKVIDDPTYLIRLIKSYKMYTRRMIECEF